MLQAEILQKNVSLYQRGKKVASLIRGSSWGSACFGEHLQVSTVITKKKKTDNQRLNKGEIIFSEKREAIGFAVSPIELVPTYSRDMDYDNLNNAYNYYKLDGFLEVKSEDVFKAEDSARMTIVKLLKNGKKKYSDYKQFIDKFKLRPYDADDESFFGHFYIYDWSAYEDEADLILVFGKDKRLLAIYNFTTLGPDLKMVQAKVEDGRVVIRDFVPEYTYSEADDFYVIANKDFDIESTLLYLVDYNDKNENDVKALRAFLNTQIGP
jgi:hypothetical protein